MVAGKRVDGLLRRAVLILVGVDNALAQGENVAPCRTAEVAVCGGCVARWAIRIAMGDGNDGWVFVSDYNGTSSAAPHVAAAAALILSLVPDLTEQRARKRLN